MIPRRDTVSDPHAHRRAQDGTAAVTYGLLVALVAAVAVTAVLLLGGVVRGAFTGTGSSSCPSSTPAPSSATTCTSGK